MKDLLINASILSSKNTGLGTYTLQMITYLYPILNKNKVSFEIMCGDKEYLPLELQDKVCVVPFSNSIERNINMMKLYNKNYKLVWSTTHHGALFSSAKQIITIHDIIPILYPKGRNHQCFYYKNILPQIIKKSESIITVSNSTKRDIISYYKKWINSDDMVKVIGASAVVHKKLLSFETINLKYGIETKNYFCIIGIHYWYKNIQAVIETFRKYIQLQKYKVVIIGNDLNEYGRYLHYLIEKYDIKDNFIFTGFINDENKVTLISNSLCCIHPSLYEGFGLPLLEAMQLDVPVISSNTSSLPEVGGDAAIYFDPLNITSLYEAIKKVSNDELRNECIQKGKCNLKRYSWNKIAHQMYDHLISFI